jgi:hypothetical protein
LPADLLTKGLPLTPQRNTRRGKDDHHVSQNGIHRHSQKGTRRPSPKDGPPPSLPDIIEAWIDTHPDRKAAGLYLTPRPIARDLLRAATDDRFHPTSVLDPAVGAGVFLEGALLRFGPEVILYGIDRDPTAVAITRLVLWITAARMGKPFRDADPLIERIRHFDALQDTDPRHRLLGNRGIDLVCGNPPFGNGIERRTARSPEEQTRLKKLFPEAAHGPYDRSALFLELGARCLTPRGRLAFLLPRALLAARYATRLREWLADEAPLSVLILHSGDRPVPDAEIAMVGWIARRRTRRKYIRVLDRATEKANLIPRSMLMSSSWGGLLHPLAEVMEESAKDHSTFDQFFTVRAGASVSEAYRIVDQIQDSGKGWRFLTSGTITRYGNRWGQAPTRHLAHDFLRPALPKTSDALTEQRRKLYASPKILVAGLSRFLRAYCDENGRFASSVGTFLVLPLQGDEHEDRIVENQTRETRLLRRATLLLNSAWLSQLHRCRAGPMSLTGGNLPLGRRDVEAFPFPIALTELAAEMKQSQLDRLITNPGKPLPRRTGHLLAILDAGFNILVNECDRLVKQGNRLLDSRAHLGEQENRPANRGVQGEEEHKAWDYLIQRTILALAGCSVDESAALLGEHEKTASPVGSHLATAVQLAKRTPISPPSDRRSARQANADQST